MMEYEDEAEEEEEREDGPALAEWRAVGAVFPEEGNGEAVPAGDGEDRRRDVPAGTAIAGGEPDRPTGGMPEADGPAPSGEWLDKPVRAAQAGAEMAEAVRRQKAEELVGAARADAGGSAAGRLAGREGGPADAPLGSGLEELYRQTARASRFSAQAMPVEQAGRTVRAEEPGRTAALTVDELDRAVRRDSRRYDGGMTIF